MLHVCTLLLLLLTSSLYVHTYRVTAFFTSIHSLYLVYLLIFHHSRTLLVFILISGDDLNKL